MVAYTRLQIVWNINKYRLNNAVIINGAAMVMHGIAGTTSEIEIVITPTDFLRLKHRYQLKHLGGVSRFELGELIIYVTGGSLPKHEYIKDCKVVMKHLLMSVLEKQQNEANANMQFALEKYVKNWRVKK